LQRKLDFGKVAETGGVKAGGLFDPYRSSKKEYLAWSISKRSTVPYKNISDRSTCPSPSKWCRLRLRFHPVCVTQPKIWGFNQPFAKESAWRGAMAGR